MSEFEKQQKPAAPVAAPQEPIARSFNPPAFKLSTDGKESAETELPTKQDSARFQDDIALKSIWDGTSTCKKGDKGLIVHKLQQALIDMGYLLPKFGVDDDFGDETTAALKQYQHDAGVAETGVFDKATIVALDTRFNTRKDYVNAAANYDKALPTKGSRTLNAGEKANAVEALKPQPKVAGKKFDPKDGPAYAAEIKAMLDVIIPKLHKTLYEDKVGLRADPAKNFHKSSNLEGAANAGKDTTDKVYGNLGNGPAFKMGTNLIDQWKDEEDTNALLKDPEKESKARTKVKYLINSKGGTIHSKYNATPSEPEEYKALSPIIESFVDSAPKVQTMLDLDIGWTGAQLAGKQYLQLYKDPDDEVNRQRMWRIFHTSIHEYLHTLAHPDYNAWAAKLGGAKQHTLEEGFCDFFTLNVRAKFPASSLKGVQKQVEGDFFDAAKDVPTPEDLKVGVYPSNKEAERMVSIIGINNAQLGYFKGMTKLMGEV